MLFTPGSGEFVSVLLLAGTALAGYAAARSALDAVLDGDQPAPGRRAMVHAGVVLAIVVSATVRRPQLLDLAIGLPFSASIAALTLALGVVLLVAAPLRSATASAVLAERRLWPFVLPTALLTLLIGFTGQLTWHHGLILATEGLALLALWPLATGSVSHENDATRSWGLRAIQLLMAMGLAAIAGWGAVEAAAGLAMYHPLFRPGVAATLALGPVVVLPMIPPIATLAERGRRDEAVTTIVTFALVNLCAVLPLMLMLQQVSRRFSPVLTAAALSPATDPSVAQTPEVASDSIPFPTTVWRLDTVLLVASGLLLLPVAQGRWNLARPEGTALMAGYVFYLFLTLLLSRG